MMRIACVVAVLGLCVGGCANAYVNGSTLAASTAALACDWAQTRSSASAGWMHRRPDGHLYRTSEANPLMGEHPATGTVDLYFLASAVVNVAIWAALPTKYKAIVPAAITVGETSSIASNLSTTRNLDTGNSGVCGI